MSNEFDDLMAGIENDLDAPAPAKKAAPKKSAAKPAAKKPAPKPVVQDEAITEAQRKAEVAVASAPDTALPNQGPKESWPVIEIDEVKGAPNFQFVQINGIPFQIKRGEPVAVPPAVLSVLQNAVGHRVVQEQDHATGMTKTRLVKYANVPYRVVSWKR